jgi:hypothetical protein
MVLLDGAPQSAQHALLGRLGVDLDEGRTMPWAASQSSTATASTSMLSLRGLPLTRAATTLLTLDCRQPKSCSVRRSAASKAAIGTTCTLSRPAVLAESSVRVRGVGSKETT